MHTNYLVFEMEFCRYLLNGINLNYFMKNYEKLLPKFH